VSAVETLRAHAGSLDAAGTPLLRYGLVFILLHLGAFTFTEVEAQAIQPLIADGPPVGWP